MMVGCLRDGDVIAAAVEVPVPVCPYANMLTL